MFEKVNPAHPDKVADRIAGALVDLAYEKDADPKIAVEVLIIFIVARLHLLWRVADGCHREGKSSKS